MNQSITRRLYFLAGLFLVGILILSGDLQAKNPSDLGFTVTPSSQQSFEVLDGETGLPIVAQIKSYSISGTKLNAVTFSKPGYTSVTLVGIGQDEVSIRLNPLWGKKPFTVVEGSLLGWDQNRASNQIYGGAVFKPIGMEDMIHADIDSIMSPFEDTIRAYKDVDIPSNLAFPDQSIFIGFGSIRLNKPTFKIPSKKGWPVRLASFQFKIPSSKVINAVMRGKDSYYDMVNELKVSRVGLFESNTRGNVHVTPNAEVQETYQVSAPRPNMNADVFLIAAEDMFDDRTVLIPTDLKLAYRKLAPIPGPVVLSAETIGELLARQSIASPSLRAPKAKLGLSHCVLSLAVSGKAHKMLGVISKVQASSVSPQPFLEIPQAHELPEKLSALPTSFELQAPGTGIAIAMFEEAAPWMQNSENTDLTWVVAVLPGLGKQKIDLAWSSAGNASVVSNTKRFSISQFDFGSSFDASNGFNGQDVFQKLGRFNRTTVSIK